MRFPMNKNKLLKLQRAINQIGTDGSLKEAETVHYVTWSHAFRMRLCWCITIRDLNTSVCGVRFRNRPLCATFGFLQFLVAVISLLQVLSFSSFLVFCSNGLQCSGVELKMSTNLHLKMENGKISQLFVYFQL